MQKYKKNPQEPYQKKPDKRNKICKIVIIPVIIAIITALIMSSLVLAAIGQSKTSNNNAGDNIQSLEETMQQVVQQLIEVHSELNISMEQLQVEFKQQADDFQRQIKSSENTFHLLITDINEHISEIKMNIVQMY